MRLALISDVHANAVALEAVLEDVRARGADRILCAGDVVGYYPYPNETVELFRKHEIVSIQGNHDRAILQTDVRRLAPVAGDAAIWTAFHLAPRSREYLRSLPPRTGLKAGGLSVAICHGSPRDDDQYVYEEEAGEDLLDLSRGELLVLGHTHIPYVKKLPGGLIVNPGSVGQPRDGIPRSSYTLFDTEEMKAANQRVAYDVREVAEATRAMGLPDYLAERLFTGV